MRSLFDSGMAERPFMSLGTSEVFRRAENAARRRDETTFQKCLAELRCRKRGEELVDELTELHELRDDRAVPEVLRGGLQVHDLADVVLVADEDCHCRLEMLRRARRSIWLSTYTIKDENGGLREALSERVRARVAVNLIVSPGPLRKREHPNEVLDELRAAKVRVTVRKNHSKLVVVDEEEVMLGSSNLQTTIFRDVAMRFRSRSVASALIDYMQTLLEGQR